MTKSPKTTRRPARRTDPDPADYVRLSAALGKGGLRPRNFLPAARALAHSYKPGMSAADLQGALQENYVRASWLDALIALLPTIFALIQKLWG